MNFRKGVRKGHIKCETCEFFEYVSQNIGLCRYFPPKALQTNDKIQGWPTVNIRDWCGQWSNNPDA